jgi:hypothetical protein
MRKSIRKPAGSAVSSAARQREVQREIENFMRALSSYPDGFARDPYLSFEQHLCGIATERGSVREERRRG